MSAEIIATILTGAGVVVTGVVALFAGFAWILRRIDALDERLSTRIDALDEKLSRRIDAVEHELVEVKIGVARIEGPRPHLLTPR